MSSVAGTRRPRHGWGVVALFAVVLALCAVVTPAAHAASANVITSLSASTSTGSAPVNSLTSDGGTTYSAPSGSSSPQAGSDDNFTEALSFNYGGSGADSADGTPDETVQTLTLALPPGLLDRLGSAAAFCTAAQLGTMPTSSTAGTGWLGGGAGCPADSQIGSLSGTVNAQLDLLGAPLDLDGQGITGNVYIMAASSSADVARIAVEVTVNASILGPQRTEVASGPIDFALDGAGQPQLTASLTLPAQATLGSSGTAATTLLPYTLENLTQTINGLTPTSVPFQIMPSSDATTTATTSVTVQANGYVGGSGAAAGATDPTLTGSAQANLTPTGAANLPYAPQLSTSVVRDSGDAIVAFTNTITQAADESPSASITLAIPSNLQPYGPNALNEVCQTPAAGFSNCTQVGTVTAATPLLSTPLTGALYLTGPPLAPSLTLSFPAPFAISIAGSVDIATNTVTFANVPDMPLTSLAVAIAGGSQGIFETTCSTDDPSGAVSASFTGQNGASATSSGAYTISGCPAPAAATTTTTTSSPTKTTTTTTPTLTTPAGYTSPFPTSTATGSGATPKPAALTAAVGTGTLKLVSSHSGRLTLFLANTAGSPAFHVIRLSAPAGTHFLSKHLARYVISGASHTRVALSHGQLVITLSGDAVQTKLTVYSNVLSVTSAAAKKIRARKTTALKLKFALTTTRKTTEQLVAKLKVS